MCLESSSWGYSAAADRRSEGEAQPAARVTAARAGAKRRRGRALGSVSGRALLGLVLAVGVLGVTGRAASLPTEVVLLQGFESERALYQATDGAKKAYPFGSVFSQADLDLVAGTLRISDFFVPGPIESLGLSFSLTQVPSEIIAAVTVLPGGTSASVVFPDIELGFQRDGLSGTIAFELSTHGATIPAGCAGRSADQGLAGAHLDLATGRFAAVGSACPYVGSQAGAAHTFEDAFRLWLRAELTTVPNHNLPEPSTALLMVLGLAGLGYAGRREPRVR